MRRDTQYPVPNTQILGVRVHDVTLSETLDLVEQFVAEGGPHQIATVNPEFVMAAQDNAAFRNVLNRAALCVPDGIGLVWASRRVGGVPLRERVAGVELTERIAERAAREGWRVFLLGAAPGVAEKTAAILQARYPGLIVAGTHAGSPSPEENDAIVEMIRNARADVLFVAYGAPAQDLWIARNLDRLGVKVALGVGGAFDFISGVAKRAPRWVQQLGLEWLHRLIHQPWRIKRQLALPRFVWQVAHSSLTTNHSQFTINNLIPLLLFLGVFVLYVSTLAPGSVPGDPSEYVFVPRILGIAHPPGYAFYTLLAWLWQNLVPIGALAYRTNLLAATAGATIAVLVYGIILSLGDDRPPMTDDRPPTTDQHALRITHHVSRFTFHVSRFTPPLFGALSAATAVDLWQHSLHANAHIVSALLATLALFLLVRWSVTEKDRWLYGFALVAGLSMTQHPLLVFGFPAYALFILLQCRTLSQAKKNITFVSFVSFVVKKLPAMLLFFSLGLSAWLYIPLRGPFAPFNRLDGTFDAFWHHVTAQGLRVNLFAFDLSDQPVRLNVFWQLLNLQYSPLALALAAVGALWLVVRQPKLAALLGLFLVMYALFVINTIQDVMAYLMLPFVVAAILAGAGAQVIVNARRPLFLKKVGVWLGLVLLMAPVYSAWQLAPRVSLRDYAAGQEWVDAVFARFTGKGERAILLAPWELMTPLWVAEAEGRALDPADVTPVYVAATSPNPYLDNVFAHWNQGPVYLADFRREMWEGGLFRLRPLTTDHRPPTNTQYAARSTQYATLWRVVPPGDTSIPDWLYPLNVMAGNQVELLGYGLDARTLRPGQTAHLILAMRAPVTPTHYLMPFALLGERAYRWTTDSRVLSITWQPGEVIVEQYDITIPFGTPPGRYPLRLGVADLSAGRDLTLVDPLGLGNPKGLTALDIGEMTIEPAQGIVPPPQVLERAIANFDSRVALMGARIQDPSGLRTIEVWLDWCVLQQTTTSYKVFVHLITPDNRLAAQGDYYTPMGGAFPSSLWIPRWIEGQTFSDPYRLTIPADLPPGEYLIEVGLYGLTDLRRAPIFDRDGNLAGDRVILSTVQIRP